MESPDGAGDGDAAAVPPGRRRAPAAGEPGRRASTPGRDRLASRRRSTPRPATSSATSVPAGDAPAADGGDATAATAAAVGDRELLAARRRADARPSTRSRVASGPTSHNSPPASRWPPSASQARSVAAGVWVGVGARDEPAELAGVSHFLEHLLFKGTDDALGAQEISPAVDRVGGDINAFTAKEYTAYYCRVPAGTLPLGVELLGDVLTAPALRDGDVDNERQVILEELAMDDDLPDDVAHRLLAGALFPDHPLGRETAGTAESVEAITADDVREFFGRGTDRRRWSWRSPAPSTTTTSWPRWSSASPRAEPARVAGPRGAARRSATASSSTTAQRAGARRAGLPGPGPARRRPRGARRRRTTSSAAACPAACSRRSASSAASPTPSYSGTSAYADAGALTIDAGTGPGQVPEVHPPDRRRAGQAARRRHHAEELDVAVGYLTGAYVMGLEDTGSRMARLGALLTTTGAVRPVAEQVERWRAVTAADVERVIERVLDQPRSLAVVGPVSEAAVRGRRRRRPPRPHPRPPARPAHPAFMSTLATAECTIRGHERGWARRGRGAGRRAGGRAVSW